MQEVRYPTSAAQIIAAGVAKKSFPPPFAGKKLPTGKTLYHPAKQELPMESGSGNARKNKQATEIVRRPFLPFAIN